MASSCSRSCVAWFSQASKFYSSVAPIMHSNEFTSLIRSLPPWGSPYIWLLQPPHSVPIPAALSPGAYKLSAARSISIRAILGADGGPGSVLYISSGFRGYEPC